MKRIFALLLSLIMTVVLVSPVSAKTTNDNASDAVVTLNALGILVGDETGDLALDKKITRAEFATILTRVLDMEDVSGASVEFTDVAKTHWAYKAIANCANLNIINGCGDGTFKPENNVSYEEATKMVMCALGYEPYAKNKGGWPTGYLVAANQAKVLEGVSAEATRGDIAQLIYNALSTPKMAQTSYGTDEEFAILDGKNGRDYETLLTAKDIYIATGIVGESVEDEVEFIVTEDSEDGEFEEDDIKYFEINGSDIENYEHSNVTVYVEKTKKKDYKVICVFASEVGNSITISAEDIKSVDEYEIEYYTSGTKTKTIKLEKDLDTMEYNKTEFPLDVYELANCENCEITFVENTGNTYYDKIIISHYISARVDEVYPEKDRISIDGVTLTFDFDDENTKILLVDAKGNKLNLDDFAEDDVVAVLSDEDTLRKYSDYIKIIRLTDSYVIGEIEETFSRNGKSYIVIDGEEYVNNTEKDLGLGDTGTFYIGLMNTIIDFDGNVAANDYGYILEAAISEESFSKGTWQIKMLTKNGISVYTLTDSASKGFDEYKESIGMMPEDMKLLYDDIDASYVNRIISYKVHSQGKISRFEAAGYTDDFKAIQGEYKDNTQRLDGVIIEDYTAIFNITSSDVDKTFCTDISYLTDESYYEGYALRIDGDYEVLVITKGKSQYANENGFAIVKKVTTTKDEDDNEIYKVTMIENEQETTLYFDEESTTDYDIEVNSELPVGSVLVYNANAKDDFVLDYMVIGIVEDGGLVLNEEAISTEFDEDVEFIYGYISNTKKDKVSAGESIEIGDDVVVVTSSTNKYTYNDAGRHITIEIGDFLAEDAYYREGNQATPVLVKIVDGDLIDIYTFNKRIELE